MNFSTFPTDNIHKFFAIVGLFVGIFNLYYSYEEMYKVNEQRLNISDQMEDDIEMLNKILAESDRIIAAHKKLSEMQKTIIAKQEMLATALSKHDSRPTRKNAIAAIELYDSIELMTASRDIAYKRIDSVNIRQDKLIEQESIVRKAIDRQDKRLKLAEDRYNFYRDVLFIGSIAGAFMSLFGFYYWIKTQERLDAILFRRPLNVRHYRRPRSLKSLFKKK